MPLHFFYERRGLTLPPIEFLDPAVMPDNERELLVHDHDMTSALEEYHRTTLHLDVVGREMAADYLLRLVVLRGENPPVPVEFGAIGIQLDAFPGPARRLIEAGHLPLGAILAQEKIAFRSHPQAFFRVCADDFIAGQLAEPVGAILWGRCNQLTNADGDVLADIVEVLPHALAPVPESVHWNRANLGLSS